MEIRMLKHRLVIDHDAERGVTYADVIEPQHTVAVCGMCLAMLTNAEDFQKHANWHEANGHTQG